MFTTESDDANERHVNLTFSHRITTASTIKTDVHRVRGCVFRLLPKKSLCLRPIAVYGVQHIVIMHDTDFGNHCNLPIWQCRFGNLASGFCLFVFVFLLTSDCDNGARQ